MKKSLFSKYVVSIEPFINCNNCDDESLFRFINFKIFGVLNSLTIVGVNGELKVPVEL